MICRMWHGWTSPANAEAYDHLLRTEIFEGIARRRIPGYSGIELLRRPVDEGVEFVTLMWFDSIAAVRAFAEAGADYDRAVVPPAARALLERFDLRSAHYEVRQPREASYRLHRPMVTLFRVVLGLALLWGSLQTLLHGGAGHRHVALIGAFEAAGAAALLVPRTVRLGALLLLLSLGLALVLHAARGEWRPDLIVYGVGVVLVAVHTDVSRTRGTPTVRGS